MGVAIDEKIADAPQAPSSPKSVIKEENNVGHIVMKEFERRIANGEPVGQWPPNGSCLRRIWVAYVTPHFLKSPPRSH